MTFYDDLGVTSDASGDDLRRAYRGRARLIHPDVNDQADSEQMRRLNRAWAVLGDPLAREEYDRTLRSPPDPPRPDVPASGHPPLVDHRTSPPRWLRPSTLILAVLLLLFIATAYAGPHHTNAPPTPATTDPARPALTPPPAQPSTGFVGSALVGKCILALPGYDAIVSCLAPSNGVVIGETTRSADCPSGTEVHQLAGQSHFVCLAARTPGG